MIGSTISHYASKTHPPLADKILEKLGETHLRSSNFGGQGGPTTLRLAEFIRRNFHMIGKVSL
jgi:hypothetical protein